MRFLGILAILVITGMGQAAFADTFPANIILDNVPFGKAVTYNGPAEDASAGHEVAMVGDINADGNDDFAISAFSEDSSGKTFGQIYVYFGQSGAPIQFLDMSSFLVGGHGIVFLCQEDGFGCGQSVDGIGDFNGDGIDDLAIGHPFADAGGNKIGSVHVVFGSTELTAGTFDLTSIDGSNGFVILGAADGNEAGYDVAGAGDVNLDGFADILIGAPRNDTGADEAGAAYLVYGSDQGFLRNTHLSDPGFVNGSKASAFYGHEVNALTGFAVAGAGDINSDGFADIMIGAPLGNFVDGTSPARYTGEVFLVFGTDQGYGSSFSLGTLNGSNGFSVTGEGPINGDGISVGDVAIDGAGDINGDGIEDLLIGFPGTDEHGSNRGQAYILFGSVQPFSVETPLSSLDGSNGFSVVGYTSDSEKLGVAVAGIGDLNGDGLDDVAISAPLSDRSSRFNVGRTNVLFGSSSGFAAEIRVSTFDGTNGFHVYGINSNDLSGQALAGGGDINGDGLADILISGHGSDISANKSGQAYALFGRFVSNQPTSIFGSILPGSRSGRLGGGEITVFETLINGGDGATDNCQIQVPETAPVTIGWQEFILNNPSNATTTKKGISGLAARAIGEKNAKFGLAKGQSRTFLLETTPVRVTTGSERVFPEVVCENASLAAIPGVNDLLLTLGDSEQIDAISIGVTPSGDGILEIPPEGLAGFLAASALNIGVGDDGTIVDEANPTANAAVMSITADTGDVSLPVNLLVCETGVDSVCLQPASISVDITLSLEPKTMGVFAFATTTVPFDPAVNRVYMRFTDKDGVERSSTSAAVRTELQ